VNDRSSAASPPKWNDTPPPFPSLSALADGLRSGYGVDAAEMEEIEAGADAAARAWRVVSADRRRLFLKVRLGGRPAAILLPRLLRDLGMDEPIAALTTLSGAGWLDIHGWTAVVMPLVDGPTALEAGLDLAGWRQLGCFAARLHATTVPPDLRAALGVDRFGREATNHAWTIDTRIEALDPAGLDIESTVVREGWLSRRALIRRLIQLSETLAARIRSRDQAAITRSLVPCHADLHAGNILLDAEGRIRIVDWDESILAPRERDLMFVRGSVVAGRVADEEADAFEAGYGAVRIDRELLAHYRVDWAVQDVSGYAWEVLYRPDRDPPTRPRARQRFMGQFDPGGQVEGAFEIAAEIGLA
jgi:spectinomycin phosphotransferase